MIDLGLCFTYAYSAGTAADLYQAVTADAASANYIDLDVANLNIAAGRPIYLIVRVGTAEDGTATSLEIRLQTDTASAFNVALKDVAMWRFLAAQLTAGAVLINQALPVQKYQQYMRLYFNAFAACGALTICAYLSAGPESAPAQIDLVEAGS